MYTTTIELSENQLLSLQEAAQQRGVTPEALLHEAISQFLKQVVIPPNRQALLQQARGMWQYHHSLPDPHTLRAEFDRSLEWGEKTSG